MRRLVVEAEITKRMEATFPRVRDLFADLPRAMRLVAAVELVEPLADGEPSFDPAHERYRVQLGPFGAGGFRGTLRLVLDVRRSVDNDHFTLTMATLPGAGNADVTIDVRAEPSTTGSDVQCRVHASPRREVPALLPMGVVRLAAEHILKVAIEGGLTAAEKSLAVS